MSNNQEKHSASTGSADLNASNGTKSANHIFTTNEAQRLALQDLINTIEGSDVTGALLFVVTEFTELAKKEGWDLNLIIDNQMPLLGLLANLHAIKDHVVNSPDAAVIIAVKEVSHD